MLLDGRLSSESLNSPDTRALMERYLTLRSRFLHILVAVGKVSEAYELAERYRDFRALVELCNHPQHGSTSRIRFFMGKYAEDFAFSLYQYYIEKGECLGARRRRSVRLPWCVAFQVNFAHYSRKRRPIDRCLQSSLTRPLILVSSCPPMHFLPPADLCLEQDLSWLNDVAIGRYGNATDALVTEAMKEQSLAQKKVSPK